MSAEARETDAANRRSGTPALPTSPAAGGSNARGAAAAGGIDAAKAARTPGIHPSDAAASGSGAAGSPSSGSDATGAASLPVGLQLLSPVQLGALRLPNRVVMAPMTRTRAGEGNVPTPLNATYYEQRASAGLIVTEATQVSPQGVGYPGTPGIHTDAQVEGWRRVTEAVHRRGGRIFLQLWHVGRISHPSVQPGGALPVAPSAIAPAGEVRTAAGPAPFVTPRALETEEIAGVVRQFADGARRAREAGFDGVEIHGANGYLIDQFLRSGSNTRTDGYGGSPAPRARFLLEVTAAVVEVWGPGRVGVRLSPTSGYNDMRDDDPLATFTHAAGALSAFPLAYLHVVETRPRPEQEETAPVPYVTPALRRAFGGPFIVNSGYDRDSAERAIASGEADAVSFATSYLANPDLPERFALGAPLNEPDRATFYGGGAQGYIDYPTLAEIVPAAAEAGAGAGQ
jgi:N-ethylmaleimide reductase